MAREYRANGLEQHLEVEEWRTALDILNVQLELFRPTESIPSGYLRQSGDSGKHIVPSPVTRRVERQISHQEWTRAYETHVSSQDADETWQLVERCRTQLSSKWRKPIRIAQQRTILSSYVSHGAKLDHLERTAANSRPHLPEENRCTQFEANEQPNDGECGEPQGRRHDHQSKIQKTFTWISNHECSPVA